MSVSKDLVLSILAQNSEGTSTGALLRVFLGTTQTAGGILIVVFFSPVSETPAGWAGIGYGAYETTMGVDSTLDALADFDGRGGFEGVWFEVTDYFRVSAAEANDSISATTQTMKKLDFHVENGILNMIFGAHKISLP